MTRKARKTSGNGARMLGAAALAFVVAAPLMGCRGERTDASPRQFFPDMDKQQRWNAQEATPFYADGNTGRMTPEHAVAFSSADFDPSQYGDEAWAKNFMAERASMLGEDDAIYGGAVLEADGVETFIDTIPVRVTREMVERGKHQYNIYCVACHGYAGDGKGMVGLKWSYPPANLTGEVYRDRANRQGKDGYLFSVIREGVWAPDGSNKMPGYKHALNEMDSWAVVSYLRTLQKARGSAWEDLTPAQQERLGKPTPAAAEPQAAADQASVTEGENS